MERVLCIHRDDIPKDNKITDNHLSWYDWQRYSFRQEEKMLMGGMTGSVIYEGGLIEYLPLLEFCEKVHLGKQTTFGLGKFKTELAALTCQSMSLT